MLAWTGALAWLWPHRLPRHPLTPIDLKTMPPVLGALALLGLTSLAPILEECLFRHYLLYRLAWSLRRGPRPVARAALLSSLAWAFGHYGLVEPFGLKFTQIFGLGLLLSFIARRHGLGAAIALHWAFNMSLIPLALIL
jgi:membrane protease YdiL (CAAX protease family)